MADPIVTVRFWFDNCLWFFDGLDDDVFICVVGLGLITSSGKCDPGYYCLLGAESSAPVDGPNGGLCARGGYCPAGTAVPLPCPLGMSLACHSLSIEIRLFRLKYNEKLGC